MSLLPKGFYEFPKNVRYTAGFTCSTLHAKNHKQISKTLSRAKSEKIRLSQYIYQVWKGLEENWKRRYILKKSLLTNQLTNKQTQSGGTIPRLLCNLWLKTVLVEQKHCQLPSYRGPGVFIGYIRINKRESDSFCVNLIISIKTHLKIICEKPNTMQSSQIICYNICQWPAVWASLLEKSETSPSSPRQTEMLWRKVYFCTLMFFDFFSISRIS